MAIFQVAKFKRDGEFFVDAAEVFDPLIVFLLGSWMDAPFHHGVKTGRWMPSLANTALVRLSDSSALSSFTVPSSV